MSVNYSSASISSLDAVHSLCFNSTVAGSIFNALSATRLVLLVPISIFILHLGYQQWRQQHSFKSASHSDIFTYNVVVMELIWSLGIVLSFLGVFSDLANIITVTYFIYSIIFFADIGFHVLTCVDRYLAVVHPVKYRELRNTRGVTIRNIGTFSVWLTSLLLTFVGNLYVSTFSIIIYFIFLVASLVVVSFFTLSVLCELCRPGPGASVGGNGRHVDQSKQRAFFTVLAIMGTLSLFFVGFLVSSVLLVTQVLCPGVSLVVHASLMWLSLPSSLVLPLLYLKKTGKLKSGR